MRATLTPAYGRDYRSKAAVQRDLHEDNDFILHDVFSPWDGRPVNLPQLIEAGYTDVNVRYSKLRKVAVFRIMPGGGVK